MYLRKIILLNVLFFILMNSSAQSIEIAFSKAKENRKNLEDVLNTYQNKDQQKFNASYHLIENMPIHFSEKYVWIDKDNVVFEFNEMEYDDIEKAKDAFKELKKSLSLKPKKNITYDVNVIDKKFLTDNIDLAFDAWVNNPWSSSYDYDTFKEYILPYRSLIEPLQEWRSEYKLLYGSVRNRLEDTIDPVEVCSKIIEEIKHFNFELERYDPTPLLGPMQLLFWREGNCPDLANVTLFACRALGVAVTFDFTPYFAASSNKHFWNTVIDKEGNHIPFNGNQDLPYVYNANYRRLGKVFRNTFSIQKDNLPYQIAENQIPEDFLKNRNLIDVTREYVDVNDINYTFENKGDLEIGYITVFNRGKWKVIHWSKLNNNRATFRDMGRDIVYLPGVFKNKELVYEQFPVLLDKMGNKNILKPDFSKTYKATLSRKNETINEYEDNNPIEFRNDEIYALMVWNGKWQMLDKQKPINNELMFQNIPENGLFLIAPEQSDFFERIFTIHKETNKITWY